jgi:Zn-dependent M16 (insulinase) family peptidase
MFSFNTPILKDFSNLFNVYSSMLFNPLLRREDFYEVVRRFTYSNDRLGFTGDLAA